MRCGSRSRSRSNCSRRIAPGAHVGFELALLFFAEIKGELLECALVLGKLFAHPLALPLKRFAQILLFPRAALLELLDGECRQFLGPRLELRQQLLDVARRRVE